VGTLKIGAQGEVSGTIRIGYSGQEALELRQQALEASADEVKKLLDEAIAKQVPDGIAAHVDHFAGLDDANAQLVAFVAVAGTLAGNSENRLSLPRLFFLSKASVPFPEEASRTLPVDMHYPAQEQEQITYALPSGYALEGPAQDVKLSWENNAIYQLKSKVAEGSVTSARILARVFTVLDAGVYEQLREFYQKVVAADRQQMVFTRAQAAKKP
jgi:hypothetical protein